MKNKTKTIIYGVILLVVFITTSVGTYAYYSFNVSNTTTIAGSVGNLNATLAVTRVVGSNSQMVPMYDNALTNALLGTGGVSPCIDANSNLSCQVYRITLQNNGGAISNLNGTITLEANSGSTYANLKWQEVTYSTTYSPKSGSSVQGMTGGKLVTNGTLAASETKTWYIAVWISEIGSNQANTDKGTFKGTVSFNNEEVIIPTVVEYVSSLYNDASKTNVTTAGDEAITQATSVNLMQDSFGNTRYYGASPNNYVTFNDELWRIIGVFCTTSDGTAATYTNGVCNGEERVKIIRNESIGSYSFDNKPSGIGTSTSQFGSNDWYDSRLMMTLNPSSYLVSSINAYSNNYWTRSSGTCYSGSNSGTKTCNFSSTGLTSTAQSMIAQTTWYLGYGSGIDNHYADYYYNQERGINIASGHHETWSGYVGLMYASDYAYATDLSVCTGVGHEYNGPFGSRNDYSNSNCKNNNWIFDSTTQWTISSQACTYCTYIMYKDGALGYHNDGDDFVYGSNEIHPSVYLKENIKIDTEDKDGSSTYPYELINPSS